MKYLKILIAPILLVLGVFIAIACEPDDICPEGTATTPRLIIDFYDVINPDTQKNVFDLVVVGVGNNSVLSGYSFVDTDEVLLPLKTDDNTTQYALIANATVNDNGTPDDESDDFLEGNQDIISISYSREEVYVSRACGYKTIYKNVTLTIEDDGDNWMLSRQPITENQSVENENEAHFIVSH
ncbi:DUF6452 family protein [Tamlana sp. 2_MG-2023]|uniref:DUF6452 family protein n=1 Tax=unclassified Tamlana TaxID=2614803 RepID=UPI0026E22D85|nr:MULTISPECIES: DUF6452 family protein [unclassified Tamlana]MDO6759272.1 DUF6452 family protein [Tamlana sp. 2_MG-2023]MDO6790589.1 DUF6452 family protein [Tamlana sp. 1_MG-2023]